MMNRRTFALRAGILWGACSLPMPASALTRVEGSAMRTFAGEGPVTYLTATVADYLDDERAEAARVRFISAAEDDYDHRYDPSVNSAELELPSALQDMPGTLILTTSVVGAAAVRTDRMSGIFRRQGIVWRLRATGKDLGAMESLIVETMRVLKVKSISSSRQGVDDDGLRTGGLWDLLPNMEEVPEGFVLYEERSPAFATPEPA